MVRADVIAIVKAATITLLIFFIVFNVLNVQLMLLNQTLYVLNCTAKVQRFHERRKRMFLIFRACFPTPEGGFPRR